jgi:hypothetical protein
MSIFKNLFTCSCIELTTGMKCIRDEVNKIQSDMNILFVVKTETYSEIRSLEDKLNNHFALLTNKIDNVIMILNTTNSDLKLKCDKKIISESN